MMSAIKPKDSGREVMAMKTLGAKKVGRITVEVEVANYSDVDAARQGKLEKQKVRRQTIQGVVDSGATKFVLPKAVVEALGLPITGKIRVAYADGRTAMRPTATGASVTLQGRDGLFTAIVEPKRKNALIGAIVLEDLDFLVDCAHQKLIPRDPRGPIAEIE